MHATKTVALGIALALAACGVATAQVRVAQWNITNWSASNVSTRGAAFQTAFYGVVPDGLYAGQQMAPDVIIVEEITQGGTPTSYPIPSTYQTTGQANVTAFLNLLNSASGSPGDWAAAPYVANQGDTGNALFYRTSKVQWLGTTTLGCGFTAACPGGTIDVGSGNTQSPRDNQRWRIRLVGYTGAGAEMYLYGGHFKAGSASTDQTRREPEGWRIRMDANALPAGSNIIVGADMNVQSSAQTFYQYLTAYSGTLGSADPRGTLSGQFLDPINKPGSWNANCSFRNIHTQEPTSSATGGMDDRHDQLLISAALRDSQGLSYMPYNPGGNILAPYINPPASCTNSGTALQQNPSPSSSAWFDGNHSYRCWGNDGNHFNLGIADTTTVAANTMVGQTIAQALVTTCAGNGHLPVYLDLQVPAKLSAPSGTINLGSFAVNAPAQYSLQISNAADLPRYSKSGTGWGIDPLTYSLSITSGPFSIVGPTGPLDLAASSPATISTHTVTLDTSSPGSKSATLTITSDDPDNPTRVLTLVATVSGESIQGACCTGTACSVASQSACSTAGGAYQGDNTVCGQPANPTTCCPANFSGSNGLTVDDIFGFLGAWFAGDPRGDFNHSGQADVQDIFDFLTAWFAGC